MPFTAPTLHYVAAGEKVLDARPAHSARYSTLDVGHVLRCTDGRHTALVRIRSVMKFDLGFGEAWDYYRSLGRGGRSLHRVGYHLLGGPSLTWNQHSAFTARWLIPSCQNINVTCSPSRSLSLASRCYLMILTWKGRHGARPPRQPCLSQLQQTCGLPSDRCECMRWSPTLTLSSYAVRCCVTNLCYVKFVRRGDPQCRLCSGLRICCCVVVQPLRWRC